LDYGGGPDQSKYVVTDEITKENVGRLEVAWFYPTDDEDGYQFSPLIAHGVMYVLAKNNSLVALDAETGEEIWIHANLRGIARRGINYWESEDGSDRRLLFQINNYLQAIDARTGESILTFGENGLVDLIEGLDRPTEMISRVQSATPGKVFENLILLGSATGEGYLSSPGHVRAYDVVTGELAWIFHTIPHPGEYGYETWPRDAYTYVGGANTWGEISVDAERGIAYFPTGSPTYDYYGADRIGQNLFANSIIALDARTGERIWHFQVVHHDLFDYDITAAPQLVSVRKDGREIDAVAVATKQGFLFVFDRVTGEPVWPIEERPVPPSHVPGEEAWPTQPFPTVPPPFARQSLSAEDANSPLLTPEEQVEWREKIGELVRTGRAGLFTPPSHLAPLLAIPGAVGGANWGGTAADPERGMVFVYTIDTPSFYEALELREAEPEAPPAQMAAQERGSTLYQQDCQACHGENGIGFGSAPPLVGLGRRMDLGEVSALLNTGRGEMPAFAYLDSAQVADLYAYIGSLGGGRGGFPGAREDSGPPSGPVVASGGAPGGLEPRNSGGRGGGRLGPPYPEGAEAPSVRYYSQGYGLGEAWAISPPWSSVVAYDLNQGTIVWQRPVGTDRRLAEEGRTDTGLPQAQRHGMVVTSTGVVFVTAGDGRIYALDADTGDELWRGELPMGTEGLPAMYEVDGKQHLVVTATTTLRWGRGDDEEDGGIEVPEGDPPRRGYVVFSLPE
jgi:quinoprotein glucose dehydrogenase